uniref:Calcineurin-like phosphoesterase n=1 Tax=Candidatus Kentrum sp. FM TaxID=2126340 RepID=A0A450TPG3_9GAMM|nr:MAG: hypothetical protein BECKFM1743C_GA0114222_105111 [Candidatus Kentron sp. FM]VFJ69846.1 MAG: hypothetical protein BECKFM1743A_GA0114220_105251 [Candidatus Kentron sp. FM]VFK17782.1 MAG: hypothetical protein BECKFM1743B_GA0114221_105021 [Candidatus Kentron sp. FM]
MTHRATAREFEKAHEFVSAIIEQFGLSARRCILVPGNHDLSRDEAVYGWRPARAVKTDDLLEGCWCKQGDGAYFFVGGEVYRTQAKELAAPCRNYEGPRSIIISPFENTIMGRRK